MAALAGVAGTLAVVATAGVGAASAATLHRPAPVAYGAKAAAAPTTDPWANNAPYYEVSATGRVWPLAGAANYGSPNLAAWHTTPAGIAVTPSGQGYWVLTANGRVANFGRAGFYGSPHLAHRAIRAVQIVATSDGRGYWVVGRAGSVQAFGDAVHHGGLGGTVQTSPIVALVPTADGGGYWLANAAGGTFAFGDATALTGTVTLDPGASIVGMAASAAGQGGAGSQSGAGGQGGAGAWLVASDGAVYALGDAPSLGGVTSATQTMGGIVATADGNGYWVVAHDGDVHPFGDAAQSWMPTTGFVHQVTTVGDRVVEWAMAQLGKPYLWGGTGPNSFDCSGLSMESWLSVGVQIPRVAAAQFAGLPEVSLANLTAGDLVYWASNPAQPATIGHVAVFLGGGQMVNAPYTGQVVSTSWIGGTGFVTHASNPAQVGQTTSQS